MGHGKKQYQDFLKTKGILSSMTLGAQGWSAHSVDPEQLSGPQVYLYVLDYETSWSWMASVQLEVFQQVAEKFKSMPHEWATLRGMLGKSIEQQAENAKRVTAQPPSPAAAHPGRPQQWEQELAMMVTGYAGTTKTGNTPGAIRPGCHFLMHRYTTRDNTPLLRPYLTGPEDTGPLTAERFFMLVGHVVGLDREAHPDWFR